MKNIFTKIATISATIAATLTIAAGINNPAQAVDFTFNWQGNADYTAKGSFSYDETIAPTIISESGAGATNFLQSLNVSFFNPSNDLLGTYNTVAGGVSQSSFFNFNFDTSTNTLFGSFNVGGGTGVIGEYFFQGTVGSSLNLRQDVDQQGTSTLLDTNSGLIQVSSASVPEPTTILGLVAFSALGVGSTLKKKKQVHC